MLIFFGYEMRKKDSGQFVVDMPLFYKHIGYVFNNEDLAIESITHPSTKRTSKDKSYERLEFLGDSILDMVISDEVYHMFKKSNEGELSKILSFLISREMCYRIGVDLNIAQFIILSNAAELNKEREVKANISNVVEAIIAAIYLDGGLEHAKSFILKNWMNQKHWGSNLLNIVVDSHDPKSKLQEISQGAYKSLPAYELMESIGPDHKPVFTVSVSVKNMKVNGSGSSKKEAEKNAAKKMIDLLCNNIAENKNY